VVLPSDVNPRIINVQLLSSHRISYLLLDISSTKSRGVEKIGKDAIGQVENTFKEQRVNANSRDDPGNDVEEAARAKRRQNANDNGRVLGGGKLRCGSPKQQSDEGSEVDSTSEVENTSEVEGGSEVESVGEVEVEDISEAEDIGDLNVGLVNGADSKVNDDPRADKQTRNAFVVQRLATDNGIGVPTARHIRSLGRALDFLLAALLLLSVHHALFHGLGDDATVGDGDRELDEPSVRGKPIGIDSPPGEFISLGFVHVKFPVFLERLLEKTLLVVTNGVISSIAARLAILDGDGEGEMR